MLGSIAGDIIGSVFEWHPNKSTEFPLFDERSHFTDDTVLTVAVAAAILSARDSRTEPDYRTHIIEYAREYPGRGYGGMFRRWIHTEDPQPYNSFGNGSAMRVGSVGFLFDTEEDVLREAKRSAEPSHNHEEGIKGAQATAYATLLARRKVSKEDIRAIISDRFGYDLNRTVAEIRATYSFDVTCQGSVPESIIAFLDSSDFERAIRLAISLGGDADTQACIAGGIAEAFYGGIPEDIIQQVRDRLDPKILDVVNRFYTAMAGR